MLKYKNYNAKVSIANLNTPKNPCFLLTTIEGPTEGKIVGGSQNNPPLGVGFIGICIEYSTSSSVSSGGGPPPSWMMMYFPLENWYNFALLIITN